ncbi:MAG: type IV toxin-antitoxin system AbiEi family antitoxin [Actinomycetota bacterium]
MPTRTVPRSVAPVLEALELDQPTIVTLEMLEKLVAETELPTTAGHSARLLRERGWLLPLRTSGVWEFAPGARAGAWGAGDPFIELRARLATRPIEIAIAAESAAWLHGLSTRAPAPHVLALPSGAKLPRSLDEFRVVRWTADDDLAEVDGLPLWSVSTILAFMGARPDKYRDWPNVSEWLRDATKRASVTAVRSELAHQPRSAWARTSYLLHRGGQDEMADELFSGAPSGRGPFHLGPRDKTSKYSSRFEVIDHVFPTWWSIKASP